MTREVDVNSGAAPQPGGWAGVEGAARGHALPGWNTEVEQVEDLNKAPDVSTPKSVQEIADMADERKSDERDPYREQLQKSVSNPKQVLADEDEGDSASSVEQPEAGEEQEAVNQASVEHSGIYPPDGPEGTEGGRILGAESDDPNDDTDAKGKKDSKAPQAKKSAKKKS